MSDKNTYPRTTKIIANLPNTIPFVGPEAVERQRGKVFQARLGANESALGPAPSVIKAIQSEAANVWQYGDPESYDLTKAIADKYSISPKNIMLGAGVDALLGLIVRQYIEKDDIVINSYGGYPTFNYHVAGYGGKLITVPYKNEYVDCQALAKAAYDHNAKIVYIANPDNPLGTWHDDATIEEFIKNVPKNCLIILDEAYCEFMPKKDLIPTQKIWPNVLRMRTFSKAYGLAGLRCGYAIGDEHLISPFNKIRDHFSTNRLAQVAALKALKDEEYLEYVLKENAKNREALGKIAKAHGLNTLPSATNFVAIECSSDDEDNKDGVFAQKVLDELIKRDIFVRKPTVEKLNRFIRVSVGKEEDIDLFKTAFAEALKSAKNDNS